MELGQADQNLCSVESKNTDLFKDLQSLKEELDESKNGEAELCEEEVAMLYEKLQFSTVQAALLEEKVTELLGLFESLETSSVEQRKMFDEEEASRIAELCALKQQLGVLEGENTDLKANLDAYLPVLLSLQNNAQPSIA
ncbi:hypothetical protein QJS10_CPA06g01628 [Acorus calamus]|uniref:Uncharacterized protein n=1 Tax=Acorus calamus TaxID=4465 RepID=A0AAV9EPM4_ACOCL|nr:hypothetical protein QJS10_CPA06g01628 [Acorus calamus]